MAAVAREKIGVFGKERMQSGTAHRIRIVVKPVIAIPKARDTRAELLRFEVADFLVVCAAKALQRVEQATRPGSSGLHAPESTLDDFAIAEKIIRLHIAQEKHVVIEIDEVLGEAFDAPEHRDNRAAVEGWQVLFVAGENFAMVDDVEAVGERAFTKFFEDGWHLPINNDMDFAEPRRETQDRANTPVNFTGIIEARTVGRYRSRFSRLG